MSSVYLAEHSIIKKRRAIKVLPRKRVSDRSYLERFYREGRAAASLNHPNIVRVYDIDNHDETHYMVMEYVAGKDISEWVEENGPMSTQEAIEFTLQGATGLLQAHEKALVHRDVKPANFLVTADGVVKVLDMGLALFREEEYSLTMAHNERVIGTADYLAPEQAINSHEVDHRADIYGLGCTLYFMLTGHPPFPSGTLAQRIAMHQTAEPEPIQREDCSDDLLQVLRAMTQKNPDARYQSCQQVIDDLQALKEGRPISDFAKNATTSKLADKTGKLAAPTGATRTKPPAFEAAKTATNKSSSGTSVDPMQQPKPVISKAEISQLPVAKRPAIRRRKKNDLAIALMWIGAISMMAVLLMVVALAIWLTGAL
jgi:serine/threonine-protein kinase